MNSLEEMMNQQPGPSTPQRVYVTGPGGASTIVDPNTAMMQQRPPPNMVAAQSPALFNANVDKLHLFC